MVQSHNVKLQYNQLKRILDDFTKTLIRCTYLAQQMEVEFPKKKYYESIQKEAFFQINNQESKSLAKLTKIKHKLLKNCQQLLDIEHDLNYSQSKQHFKKVQQQTYSIKITNGSENGKVKSFQSHNFEEITNPEKIEAVSSAKQRQQLLPFYLIKNEKAQSKLDSINKFVSSLKRSIKAQTSTSQKSKAKQRLQQCSHYNKLKAEIQKSKNRQQKIKTAFSKAVEMQIHHKLHQNYEILNQKQNFSIVKLQKEYEKPENKKTRMGTLSDQDILDNFERVKTVYTFGDASEGQDQQLPKALRNKTIDEKIMYKDVKKRVEEDFEEIKKFLNIQNQQELSPSELIKKSPFDFKCMIKSDDLTNKNPLFLDLQEKQTEQ